MSSQARDKAERLLARAAQEVPLWRDLLGGRGPAEWTWGDLPITDRQLICDRFDDSVRGRAVSRERAVAHYRAAPGEPLADGTEVFVSAGARGEPAPFLCDTGAWRANLETLRRALEAIGAEEGGALALVGTDDPAHTLPRLRSLGPEGETEVIGLQEGVDRACERIEELRPRVVFGIASAIALIAAARPKIAPGAVMTGTDALGEAEAELIEDAFGIVPRGSYATTELGLLAAQCERGGAMHVSEEQVLVEGTGAGACATNLENRIQPIIRFALPEQVEVWEEACACGRTGQRLRFDGGRVTRAWDLPGAQGGTVPIHPIVLRSALDPLLLRQLPKVSWEGGAFRVEVEAEAAEEARKRVPFALARAGADPAVLEVVGLETARR
jgi:hypothetical protein